MQSGLLVSILTTFWAGYICASGDLFANCTVTQKFDVVIATIRISWQSNMRFHVYAAAAMVNYFEWQTYALLLWSITYSILCKIIGECRTHVIEYITSDHASESIDLITLVDWHGLTFIWQYLLLRKLLSEVARFLCYGTFSCMIGRSWDCWLF